MSTQQRYISNELTHLVGRGKLPDEQYQILLKILREKRLLYSPTDITTHNEHSREFVYKYNQKISDNNMINPSMVCFCDIPIEDLNIHIKKYSPFGISFTKDFIVSKGGCPLFYIPIKAAAHSRDIPYKDGYFDKYCKEVYLYFDAMIVKMMDNKSATPADKSEKEKVEIFHDLIFNQILSYVKFFDHTLLDDHADNYYFEREWRILGNLYFELKCVQRVIMPKSYEIYFCKDFPEYCGQINFV